MIEQEAKKVAISQRHPRHLSLPLTIRPAVSEATTSCRYAKQPSAFTALNCPSSDHPRIGVLAESQPSSQLYSHSSAYIMRTMKPRTLILLLGGCIAAFHGVAVTGEQENPDVPPPLLCHRYFGTDMDGLNVPFHEDRLNETRECNSRYIEEEDILYVAHCMSWSFLRNGTRYYYGSCSVNATGDPERASCFWAETIVEQFAGSELECTQCPTELCNPLPEALTRFEETGDTASGAKSATALLMIVGFLLGGFLMVD